jgi:hypothetical protein
MLWILAGTYMYGVCHLSPLIFVVPGLIVLYALAPEGTLDGQTYALRSDGFSEAGKKAPTPVKLQLPAPTKSIRYTDNFLRGFPLD